MYTSVPKMVLHSTLLETRVIRFLVLCSISCTVVVFSEVKTSCSVDQNKTITCTFSENINETKRQFIVQKYRLNSTSNAAVIVLDCLWPAENPDKTDCVVSPGYTFTSSVSTTLQLHIPNPSGDFSGRYECQALPSRPGDLQSCDLIAEDLPTTTTTHSNLTGTTIADTSSTAATLTTPNSASCTGDVFPAHLAFIAFSLLLLAANLCFVAVFAYKNSFRIRCRPKLCIYRLPTEQGNTIEQKSPDEQNAGSSRTSKMSDMSTQVNLPD